METWMMGADGNSPNHPNLAISSFDRWSSNWSANYQENGQMASRISRFIDALTPVLPDDARILDFGCGTGEIARGLAASDWQVTACDASAAMVDKASKADPNSTVTWVHLASENASSLPFEDGDFDAVISSSVFEYLPEPHNQAKEIARILGDRGRFYLTVPDPRHATRRREAKKLPLARCTPIWRLIGLTRWRDEFTYLRISINRWPPSMWVDLLNAAGFTVEPPADCAHPLLMLVARKPSAPSD
jgi:ubiquinone/menaquinone biosynthesis C-methylase UbiE